MTDILVRQNIFMPLDKFIETAISIEWFNEATIEQCEIISVSGIFDVLVLCKVFDCLAESTGLLIGDYEETTISGDNLKIVKNILVKKFCNHAYPIVRKFAKELCSLCDEAIQRGVSIYFIL